MTLVRKGIQLPLPLDEQSVRPICYYEEREWDDRRIEAKVDTLIIGGFPVPVSRYPLLKEYNGASGQERRDGGNKFYIARSSGLIPWGTHCSVCMSKDKLGAHNENYFRPVNARPICRGCHQALHKRFYNKDHWLRHAAANLHHHPKPWFEHIAMFELGRQQALWLAEQNDPFDARQLALMPLQWLPAIEGPLTLSTETGGMRADMDGR